jgi:hypothetical protein
MRLLTFVAADLTAFQHPVQCAGTTPETVQCGQNRVT